MQVLLRRCRRHRVVRGRRTAPPGTPARRGRPGPPGPRRDPRQRGQPGRRQQRAHRPEHDGPAGRHRPRPARGRPAGRGRRRRRGARHRNAPRRPHRGAGPGGGLRPRTHRRVPAVAGLPEVEPGAHAGRRRGRRRDQDGPGPAGRSPPRHPPLRPSQPTRGLGEQRPRPAHRGTALAARRAAPARRRVLVRDQRNQRPPRPGGGPRRTRTRERPGRRPLCVAVVRSRPGVPSPAGVRTGRLPGPDPRHRPAGRRPRPARPHPLHPPRRGGRRHGTRPFRRAREARPRRHRPGRPGHLPVPDRAPRRSPPRLHRPGLRLPRAGLAVAGDGARAVRGVPGLPRQHGRVRRSAPALLRMAATPRARSPPRTWPAR